MNYWNDPIQFMARQPQYLERLAPVYLALPMELRGEFFVPAVLTSQAEALGLRVIGLRASVNQPLEVKPPGSTAPMVTTGYRDLLTAVRSHAKRPQIYFQNDEFRAGASDRVTLFVCPSEERREWVKRNWANKTAVTAETPEAAAKAIASYIEERCQIRPISEIDGESIGIIYMSFGEKAAEAVKHSYQSLRRVGLQIPACVIGWTPVEGMQFVEWTGESPFDASQRRNFQFRAGRVKPKLYAVSPFDRTLYLDADTEFMGDILPGFECLDEYDVALARENLTLKQLYNQKLAGWEINLIERDATIKELGRGDGVFFINSGVLFFRKSAATEAGMRHWHEAWMEWQQWDEQLAFMRGFHRTPEAKVKVLEPEWNHPHRRPGIVIFHNYGRGVVRMNVTEQQKVMA